MIEKVRKENGLYVCECNSSGAVFKVVLAVDVVSEYIRQIEYHQIPEFVTQPERTVFEKEFWEKIKEI